MARRPVPVKGCFRVIAGYGAVKSKRKPEDYRQVRRQVEEEMGKAAAGKA
ncbi:MAG: hypothetical protein Q8P00_05675 [Dehalococcoidia bacterium]|nr:hypothetical protein [Dehalococcoidia bacterium]